MAPVLRERKSKTELAAPAEKPEKATKAAKKTPAAKVEKRKANEDASPIAKKKQKDVKGAAVPAAAADKKSKKAAAVVEEVEEKKESPAPKKSTLKKEKALKKSKKEEPVAAPEPEEESAEEAIPSDNEQEEDDEEVDIETQALVETLDSDEEEAPKQISTYKKGQDVGKAPKPKKAAKIANGVVPSGKPGVMYLGSIPHGFYEHEIKQYFSQFGEITRLRVVRNKKTGASRHRAFVEFADAEVADIAARTMDSYLLFGHILKAKLVNPSQVHPELFKGANSRFKAVPWNEMVGRHLQRPLGESKWQAKVAKEEQKRAARAEKLKAIGYEFEAPALKAPEVKELLENGAGEEAAKAFEEAEPVKEIEEAVEKVEEEKAEAPTTISQAKVKKGKKGAKAKKVKA